MPLHYAPRQSEFSNEPSSEARPIAPHEVLPNKTRVRLKAFGIFFGARLSLCRQGEVGTVSAVGTHRRHPTWYEVELDGRHHPVHLAPSALEVLLYQPLLPPAAEMQCILIWRRTVQDILADLATPPRLNTAMARATCLASDMEESIPEFRAYPLAVWATNAAMAAIHAQHGRISDALRITRDLLGRLEQACPSMTPATT